MSKVPDIEYDRKGKPTFEGFPIYAGSHGSVEASLIMIAKQLSEMVEYLKTISEKLSD